MVAEHVISSFLPQDGASFKDQLNCLMSIQSALEVVCLCQRVLQLPHLALRDIVNPLLEHYRDNVGQEFSFQLGVCLLKGFFQHQEYESSRIFECFTKRPFKNKTKSIRKCKVGGESRLYCFSNWVGLA